MFINGLTQPNSKNVTSLPSHKPNMGTFKCSSGGELLELRLLDTHLLDTFGSKSIARHKFCHLLESS